MRYIILNLIFSSVVIVGLIAITRRKINKGIIYSMVVIVLLTALFDSLIIHFGVVGYDTSKILGIYIWRAPIEDFAYAVVSVITVALLWEYYEAKHK